MEAQVVKEHSPLVSPDKLSASKASLEWTMGPAHRGRPARLAATRPGVWVAARTALAPALPGESALTTIQTREGQEDRPAVRRIHEVARPGRLQASCGPRVFVPLWQDPKLDELKRWRKRKHHRRFYGQCKPCDTVTGMYGRLLPMTHVSPTPNKDRLKTRARAYVQLPRGAEELLKQDDALFWTERLLLRLVRALYGRRLEQLLAIIPVAPDDAQGGDDRLRENMLEAAVTAALDGHELGPWTETENGGYQAVCSRCGKSVYVSHKTMYSVLGAECPGRPGSPS